MTQDEIIEMARQAGCWWIDALDLHWVCPENLEAFAKLVAAKEREACAKVCEELLTVERYERNIGLLGAAVAIRKRGQEC